VRDRRESFGRSVYTVRTRTLAIGLVLPLLGLAAGATAAAPGTARTKLQWQTGCKVTVATTRTRPPKPVPRSFDYGNARIAVALNPPSGKLVAGRLPGGGLRATINRDGSIDAKVGWWRAKASPRITIVGRRLDAPAAALKAYIPHGYDRGFQATGLTFPTPGCWRVTGTFGNAHLTFVVLVTKSRLP
jgi:hypothetical protein